MNCPATPTTAPISTPEMQIINSLKYHISWDFLNCFRLKYKMLACLQWAPKSLMYISLILKSGACAYNTISKFNPDAQNICIYYQCVIPASANSWPVPILKHHSRCLNHLFCFVEVFAQIIFLLYITEKSLVVEQSPNILESFMWQLRKFWLLVFMWEFAKTDTFEVLTIGCSLKIWHKCYFRWPDIYLSFGLRRLSANFCPLSVHQRGTPHNREVFWGDQCRDHGVW